MSQEVNFDLETTVPEGMRSEFLSRIKRYYFMLHPESFDNVRQEKVDGNEVVRFTSTDKKDKWKIDGEVWVDKVVHVRLLPSETTPQEIIDQLRSALTSVVKVLDEGFR